MKLAILSTAVVIAVIGGLFLGKWMLDFVEYVMENFGSEDDPHQ